MKMFYERQAPESLLAEVLIHMNSLGSERKISMNSLGSESENEKQWQLDGDAIHIKERVCNQHKATRFED